MEAEIEELEIEELNGGRKKTVVLSLAGLSALAAGGEGYRRRRQADSSSDWARKGLVLVLVLAALAALGIVGARRRRGANADELTGETVSDGDGMVERITPAGAGSSSR